MAIAKAEILDAIANMTVLELSQLIKEMEDKFGVKISDDEAEKISTVGQAVEFVAARS